MQIGVLGISGKEANILERERVARLCREWMERVAPFPSFPFVSLTTCHRSEMYFSFSERKHGQAAFSFLREHFPRDRFPNLYTLWGGDCFKHLVQVTSGLDSVIKFETDIQRQVKKAYEEACQNALSKELHFLFQKTLKLAKRVRSKMIPTHRLSTLEGGIYHVAEHYFSNTLSPRILFVGASATNASLASYMQRRGWENSTFCNRTPLQVDSYAEIPWEARNTWSSYDWVIVATKAPGYLLPLPDVLSETPTLIMDLSVPRNVHPEYTYLPGVTLYNIDQLGLQWREEMPKIDDLAAKIAYWTEDEVQRQMRLFLQKEERKKEHFALSA